MDSELDSAGLTTPQYAALSILEEEAGLSNAELARRCFLAPQTMHKIVTGLEDKGLVQRTPDPSHGRKINTSLTSDGKSVLRKAHSIVEGIESDMTESLGEQDIKLTIKNLEQCIESLEGG